MRDLICDVVKYYV